MGRSHHCLADAVAYEAGRGLVDNAPGLPAKAAWWLFVKWLDCDDVLELCPEWWVGDEVTTDRDAPPLERDLALDADLTVVIMPIFADDPIIGDGAAFGETIADLNAAAEHVDPHERCRLGRRQGEDSVPGVSVRSCDNRRADRRPTLVPRACHQLSHVGQLVVCTGDPGRPADPVPPRRNRGRLSQIASTTHGRPGALASFRSVVTSGARSAAASAT